MSRFLADALAYWRRGWSIIPIGREKRPALPTWKPYQTARPTEPELRGWFGNGAKLGGLGVIFGDVSGGLVARDFDDLAAYTQWASSHPELARTLPTVGTARGRHVYCRARERRIVKLSDGELRGGGYCVLPPSVHPTGTLYTWVNPLPDGPLPELDPWACGLAIETERTERTECTESTERTERTEETEELENVEQSPHAQSGSVDSVHSVSPDVDAALEAAIAETLPTTLGQRNRAVFDLARALKAIPGYADADTGDLRDIVRRWHELALPVIGTKPFDDTWADFVSAWPNVRFPRGAKPMLLILERADAAPLPDFAARYDSPDTHRLIRVCRELQAQSGTGPFFLSCRTAGELLGIEYPTAFRRLRMLESDGVLQAVKRGNRNQATRYRYVGGE